MPLAQYMLLTPQDSRFPSGVMCIDLQTVKSRTHQRCFMAVIHKLSLPCGHKKNDLIMFRTFIYFVPHSKCLLIHTKDKVHQLSEADGNVISFEGTVCTF